MSNYDSSALRSKSVDPNAKSQTSSIKVANSYTGSNASE